MPCDWYIGSECATVTRLDITHNIQAFITWQESGYNQFGCNWFNYCLNTIAANWGASSNPITLANRESKLEYWRCMSNGCGCPQTATIYRGCMDDGQQDHDYINNRGTWDFLTLNNTTSSGVVTRVDGEGLSGKQTGSAYPGTAAGNYYPSATVEDGSCIYYSELPYILDGCRDSTPHGAGIALNGYPDVNGHGTAAIYDCVQSQTVPTTPDPCGTGPYTPCVANNPGNVSNTGYYSQNFNPCANFDCSYGQYSSGNYASDMNSKYTRWEDGPGWGSDVFRPFGDTHCCKYPPPIVSSNPDITYDFRLAHAKTHGGISFSGNDTNWPPLQGFEDVIGKEWMKFEQSRWDVVGNEMFVSVWDFAAWMIYGVPYPAPTPPGPRNTINIRIYDIHKNLIADYDYKFQTGTFLNCPMISDICWTKSRVLRKIAQNYPDPVQFPNHEVDLKPHTAGGGLAFLWDSRCDTYQYNNYGMPPVGYVRIDSAISGMTVDTGNVLGNYAPRIPSTHWIPPGAGSPSPRGNTANLTNHWTGNNFNADPGSNPYPWVTPTAPLYNQNAGMGYEIPHSCGFCCANCSAPNNGVIRYHWLEPGPNDWTRGNWFYNNPTSLTHPSSIHTTYAIASSNCSGFSIIGPRTGSNGSESEDCGDYIEIKTKITYSKNENQEVIIIPSSVDTSLPAQTTPTPPPTTRIPPPTTPTTPPTFSPDRFSTGRDGY